MKLQTELMRQILKNQTAQQMIDYVSPIYGSSYVGLWLYEVIGMAIGEIGGIMEQLRYETSPMTTELLMDYWEDYYELHRDSNLTMEERRERLLDKIRFRAPCNPKRLAKAMEQVLDVPVDITERVAKNTFRVEILDSVSDFDKLLYALSVLESRKPAHLIYQVNVTSQVDETHLKLATAVTQAEAYKVGVEAIKLTLQTTLKTAIKLGAAVSIGEQYKVEPENIEMKARIAVETAFRIASPVYSSEEYHIEEVTS